MSHAPEWFDAAAAELEQLSKAERTSPTYVELARMVTEDWAQYSAERDTAVEAGEAIDPVYVARVAYRRWARTEWTAAFDVELRLLPGMSSPEASTVRAEILAAVDEMWDEEETTLGADSRPVVPVVLDPVKHARMAWRGWHRDQLIHDGALRAAYEQVTGHDVDGLAKWVVVTDDPDRVTLEEVAFASELGDPGSLPGDELDPQHAEDLAWIVANVEESASPEWGEWAWLMGRDQTPAVRESMAGEMETARRARHLRTVLEAETAG